MGLVGESGPEAIIPLSHMSPALAGGGGGDTYEVHIHAGAFTGTEIEARSFARHMAKYLREENKRR
jgi:hypothetical protein